jgi:hypothetical protein
MSLGLLPWVVLVAGPWPGVPGAPLRTGHASVSAPVAPSREAPDEAALADGAPPAEGQADAVPVDDAATAPEDGLEASTAEPEVVTPAPLPPDAPPPPRGDEPRAWGGVEHAPLPEPPPKVDGTRLTNDPWRGRMWLGLGLSASIPLGGRVPAAGGVVSPAGELALGWRVNRYLGLHTAISSFAHDAGRRTVVRDGTVLEEVQLGRITAFDLVTARVFVPVHRRIDPWVEAGAGVGVRRGPFAFEREAVGLARAGVGVDLWLTPALSLGSSTAYRMVVIGNAIGHGLRVGADLGLHW